MSSLVAYIPLLLRGTIITITAWAVSSTISLLIGTLVGIVSCRYFECTRLRVVIKIYTFIAKGIPAYVQILIAYFVIPSLLGINVPGFVAACSALAFCSSGYVTEIIRSGINAVSRGQWDACKVLGYPLHATLTRIILPQAVANILPALFGELEQLLKSTSLLATIGVMELTRSGMNIISRELNPLPVYGIIAGIYLILSGTLHVIGLYVERGNGNGYR